MFSMQRRFKTNQEFVRAIQSNVLFKIDVFLVSSKKEIPNKSICGFLESFSLKMFSSILRMLLRKIDLSSEKMGH